MSRDLFPGAHISSSVHRHPNRKSSGTELTKLRDVLGTSKCSIEYLFFHFKVHFSFTLFVGLKKAFKIYLGVIFYMVKCSLIVKTMSFVIQLLFLFLRIDNRIDKRI